MTSSLPLALIRASLSSGRRRWGVGALMLGVLLPPAGYAQTTTVHTFSGGATDGLRPSANLALAADGTIYGVTAQGGTGNNGTVFRLRSDGSGVQVVYSFASGSGAPTIPAEAFILGRDGVLYGTSEFGGSATFGTLYRINPEGTGFAVLRSFTAGGPNVVRDGGAPRGGLVHASDGFLYGCTTTGTISSTNLDDRNGVIYRIAPDGSGYSLIASFDGGNASPVGRVPTTLIEGRDGRLYGTARSGGANGGGGVVFALRPDGSGYTVLHSFSTTTTTTNPRGNDPQSPLVHAADGYLYGTTSAGGAAGDGCVYRLLPDGSAFEVIYSFAAPTAAGNISPMGAFFQGRDGSLYGRTRFGGTSNFGFVFKIRPDGSGFRNLASFPVASSYNHALIQANDGALYATTDDRLLRIVETPGLEITQQPRSQTIAPGGSVTFTVTAPGATTYQWRRNNTNIAGATGASYTLNALTPAANATYSVVVGNATESVTSNGAVLLVATPNPGRLINLSVRTTAGSGAETLIAGFVVGGTGSKQVLVRAIGPTLGAFGVTGVLADPALGLFNASNAQISANGGWGGSAALRTAFAQVGAFALDAAARDAALLSPLPAGGYSAQVVSASGGTGVALVEAYDADGAASTSRFINLSARTVAGTGAQSLIAGFVLSGNVPRTLLIRGIGPTLGAFGVAGALANPRLELHTTVNNRDTTVAANAGWGGSPALSAAFAQVGAFALPVGSADAALLITLTPGSYTAQVAGAGNTTGIALVEVYELP
ncbi:MAG: hypothetical protein JNL92_23735 [Opitutaceae bacterium]|nr:hypothetical protein [Opitutaceae bacterium]